MTIEQIMQLVGILRWPAVALVVGLVVVATLRRPLATLLLKLRRVGYGDKSADFSESADISTAQQAQTSSQPKPTLPSANNVAAPPPPDLATQPIETEIRDTLRQMVTADDIKISWLVRALARTRIEKNHETNYRLIVGSQLSLLLQANTPAHLTYTAAHAIYDAASIQYPDMYPKFDFDNWISWPKNAGLIEIEGTSPDSKIQITAYGRDFLQYLVAYGLTSPKYA